MQITNKKLAFYVALIAASLTLALLVFDHITTSQAQLALVAIAGICAPLGIADAVYDYLGIIFKVAETAASLTPDTEDDKKVAAWRDMAMGISTAQGKAPYPVIDPALKERIEEAVG